MIVIARLTVRELVRRRVVWVLAGLTILSVALVALGLDRLVSLARADGTGELEIRIGVSQVLIMIAFMFSFVLAMTAAFVGAPAIGGELESGVAQSILARPLRRAEVLLGRWLGSAVIVVGYTIASGLLAIAVATQIAGYGPPEPILAVAFLSGQALVLLTLDARPRVDPAVHRGRGDRRRGVRAGLDGRRPGRGGRGVRRRAAGPGGRGQPLGLPERRPVARGHLRSRATAGRHDRDRQPAEVRRRQPVLRLGAAGPAVRRLVHRLDRAGARHLELVVRASRPLTDGRRRGARRPSAPVAEAARQVVVDQPDALHERIHDGRADEPEPPISEVARQRVGHGGRGRDLPAPGFRGRRAGGCGTRAARYRSNVPNSSATRSRAAALPMAASILARFRTIPASAISRSRSASSKPATTCGSKPWNAARKASRLRRIVDHDSPAWNDSSASRSNSSTSSRVGMPHSRSWYATINGSGEGPSAEAHEQRGRTSITRPTIAGSGDRCEVEQRAAKARIG